MNTNIEGIFKSNNTFAKENSGLHYFIALKINDFNKAIFEKEIKKNKIGGDYLAVGFKFNSKEPIKIQIGRFINELLERYIEFLYDDKEMCISVDGLIELSKNTVLIDSARYPHLIDMNIMFGKDIIFGFSLDKLEPIKNEVAIKYLIYDKKYDNVVDNTEEDEVKNDIRYYN